jgi:hypothetical protein
MESKSLILVGIAMFWAGFVCAISFMEAWLKFKAEGVTRAIGLSIGKKIFKGLNNVEWVLFVLFTLVLSYHISFHADIRVLLPVLLLIILLLQTFYLLPQLNKRADLIMEGQKPKPSYIHVQYVAIEFFKICLLILTGFVV